MTHTKFGVKMSRHCRDKDLIIILAACLNFTAVVGLYENIFVNHHEIHSF